MKTKIAGYLCGRLARKHKIHRITLKTLVVFTSSSHHCSWLSAQPNPVSINLEQVQSFLIEHSQLSAQWSTTYVKHSEAITCNPQNIARMYAGSTWNFLTSYDSGRSWFEVSSLSRGNSIRQILIPRSDTGIILLASSGVDTARGLFRSANGGKTFTKVLSGYSHGPTLAEFGRTILFASYAPPIIWRSDDLGLNWSAISSGVGIDSCLTKVCSFYASKDTGRSLMLIGTEPGRIYRSVQHEPWKRVFDSSYTPADEVAQLLSIDGDTCYAALSNGRTFRADGILISTDSGQSWQRRESPANLWCVELDPRKVRHAFFSQFVSIDPRYPYSSVYESHDAGATLTPVGDLKDDTIWDLFLEPKSMRLFASGKKGIHVYQLTHSY